MELNESELKNLINNGYLVVRQFLSSEDINKYNNLYTTAKSYEPGEFVFEKNKAEALLGLPYFSLHDKINALVDLINKHTNFNLNYCRPTAAFFDTSITSLMWHQDDDTHNYRVKNYRSVNFWMPIFKPDPAKSGLCIIPPPVLRKKDQLAHDNVIGRGDIAFVVKDNETTVISGVTHEKICTFDFDIEPLGFSPVLFAGDLLLFRGDVPHRTQDHDTKRVAIGIRCSNNGFNLESNEGSGL